MIWVLLATLSFQCTMYMRSPSHLGRDSTRRMSGSRLLNAASSQVTWGTWPGFCRQVPCSVHPASAHFSLLQFLLRFSCLSYIQLTSQFPFHLLYLYHQPSLVYHFTCSTGSIKDAVRTSPYPWFDKEETEACDHKAMQWPSWVLTPTHFMLSGEKSLLNTSLSPVMCRT